jgi:hypothetical protein
MINDILFLTLRILYLNLSIIINKILIKLNY